jgi:hypothetical protein
MYFGRFAQKDECKKLKWSINLIPYAKGNRRNPCTNLRVCTIILTLNMHEMFRIYLEGETVWMHNHVKDKRTLRRLYNHFKYKLYNVLPNDKSKLLKSLILCLYFMHIISIIQGFVFSSHGLLWAHMITKRTWGCWPNIQSVYAW